MAQVLLLSATPSDDQTDYNLAPLHALQENVRADRFRAHRLTEDPEGADVILFVELYGGGFHFERVRAHPLVKKHREKCFLFCSNAFVIPFLPGIYASIEKRWSSGRTNSGFYLGTLKNEFTTYTAPTDDLPYLFSFMGSTANAPVRRRLATLFHPRSFFQNTAEEYSRLLHREMRERERRDYHRRYSELGKATKFLLCPRGLGASTMRLFETMRMGRVPVILSDAWVEPPGPGWNEFSIRVRERDFWKVPQILEERERDSVAMGELAHREWKQWFSEEAAFHRIVESCLEMKSQRRIPESLARLPVYLQYLRPFHLRQYLRGRLRGSRASARDAAGVTAAAIERAA
jgi:hypothetical protein